MDLQHSLDQGDRFLEVHLNNPPTPGLFAAGSRPFAGRRMAQSRVPRLWRLVLLFEEDFALIVSNYLVDEPLWRQGESPLPLCGLPFDDCKDGAEWEISLATHKASAIEWYSLQFGTRISLVLLTARRQLVLDTALPNIQHGVNSGHSVIHIERLA